MKYLLLLSLLVSTSLFAQQTVDDFEREKARLELRIKYLKLDANAKYELEMASLRYIEVMVALDKGIDSQEYKDIVAQHKEQMDQIIADSLNPVKPEDCEDPVVVKEKEPLTLDVFAGPTSGVIYHNVPLSFQGPWLGSEYQKGSIGHHEGVKVKGQLGELEVIHVTMNKSAADPTNIFIDGNNKHVDLLQIRYLSAGKKFDKIKPLEVGTRSRANLFYSYNKYEQNYAGAPVVDETKPIQEFYMVVAPEIYAKKEWKLLESNPKFGVDFRANAALSPLTYSKFKSNNANRMSSSPAKQNQFGMEGSFGVAALMKLKDKNGEDKWVLTLSYDQTEAHAYGKTLSMSENSMGGKLDYKVSDKVKIGAYFDQTRRMMTAGSVETRSYTVFNNMGVSASIKLGQKKKKK
jgi:hypothetical protein